MTFRAILPILAITVVAASAKLATAQEADKKPAQSQGKTGHLEVPRDPFIKIPRSAQPTSPGFRFSRNGYVSVQVNVDENGDNIVGDAANEPSIAIDPTDPSKIVIGWRQFDSVDSDFRQSGVAYSHDAGLTWTFPGSLWPGHFGSDPVLAADSSGNFYYTAIGFDDPGVRLFRSFDAGVTWDGPWQILRAFRDKQWVVIDQTGGIGDGNLYMTWSHPLNFTRSTDGGLTWQGPIHAPISDTVWGTLSVGHDGALYLVDREFNVAVSFDAQDPTVWPPDFPITSTANLGGVIEFGGDPNPGGLLGQPWIVTDHSSGPARGNVYVLCSVRPPTADPLDVMIARSTDGGRTWSAPIRVNDDPDDNNAWQWFGTLSVAPSGRLDAVWYDTRNSGQARLSEVFYAYSTDQGQTWSQNLQVAPVFDSWIGWPQQNKIGDYIGMFSDELGAGVAYAATYNGEQDVYYVYIQQGCPGDVDGDGDTDHADLGILLADWGCVGSEPGDCPGDLDGDFDTDHSDLGILLADWGCGT